MLTRLKVKGFKNLVDVDVYFGAFTCIAGGNGAGKSNLFDAIQFLKALTERSLLEAALSVRNEGGTTQDIRNLFHKVGNTHVTEMRFEAEMIIPGEGIDPFGQSATASSTFLRYSLSIIYNSQYLQTSTSPLQIKEEELTYIKLEDVPNHIFFERSKDWEKSTIKGKRTTSFIETTTDNENNVIQVRQDQQQGRPLKRQASSLPRTVLSSLSSAEYPTAMLARQEMQSWKLLQLEPSALRKPDDFVSPTSLGTDGSHLPATLFRLAYHPHYRKEGENEEEAVARVYSSVGNRLFELLGERVTLDIDSDDKRNLRTLQIAIRDGSVFPARSLSDGTLRFLALSAINIDPSMQGMVCMEEPENGIHPARIPAMLELLQEIAMDTEMAIGEGNPLRQVIVNTHSPSIVQQIPADSLLCIVPETVYTKEDKSYKQAAFFCLADTWRATKANTCTLAIGEILSYLIPVQPQEAESSPDASDSSVNDSPHIRLRISPLNEPYPRTRL